MESYRPAIGTLMKDLDTPCLLVDVDALEHNYRVVAETYRDTTCKMRQHAKNVKTPVVLKMQMDAGGSVGGVCTAKVAEAEVMVEGGIDDILITSQIATADKLSRICALARRADMKVVVDDTRNVQLLSDLAQRHQATVGVLIEVDTSMGRAGVRDAERGVEIARFATEAPGIVFKGVMSHQSTAEENPDRETRVIEGRRWIQQCLDVKDAIEAAGIPVEIVSTGETWTYDVAQEVPGVTEVEGGTYALMSTASAYMEDFDYAVKVLGTVISTPRPGIAIGDVGVRALASPRGVLPTLHGVPGVAVDSLHEEHVVLRSEGEMPLRVGDNFLLHSGQQDILVNRWDQFVAVRGDVVEAVWDIPARGCHH